MAAAPEDEPAAIIDAWLEHRHGVAPRAVVLPVIGSIGERM